MATRRPFRSMIARPAVVDASAIVPSASARPRTARALEERVDLGGERRQRDAVVERQPAEAGADEQPTLVVTQHDRIVLAAKRRGAGKDAERAALEDVRPDSGSVTWSLAVQERRPVESRRRPKDSNGRRPSGRSPARSGSTTPSRVTNVRQTSANCPASAGRLARAGTRTQLALGIGREVAELADAADVDAAGVVDRQRAHGIQIGISISRQVEPSNSRTPAALPT